MNGFEREAVSPHTEGLGRLDVPLRGAEGGGPLVLPEGTVVSVGLTFRLGREIDGLAFEEVRARNGTVLSTARTVLGGFRPGGSYEVRLPTERLPMGQAYRGCTR
ncbi:hypothetical protein BU197_07615 [Streptomyces sp. CBMA291]|nr:hypothetical protein [Streptomyces sp. CBMA291]MBD0716509.1 hypothetical protein [Streptomyces sp. CBMA370]